MCGRYSFYPGKDFSTHYGITHEVQLDSNYNASPGQLLPVIINSGNNSVTLMKWGLVPHWAKDSKIGNRLINSRSESIALKPSFKSSFARRRCLIPARGFFEWKKTESGKIPYYFSLPDHHLFSFAGIYDHWSSSQGDELTTYCIITTEANSQVEAVHHRMPVILSSETEAEWLNPKSSENQLLQLLRPLTHAFLNVHPVSARINYSTENSQDLIRPV